MTKVDGQESSAEKAGKPHAHFDGPQEVVVDPALSKEQKIEALDSLEQDARQLLDAASEGMTGGELNRLHDVLDAKDALELPPTAYAYEVVLRDLQSRLKGEVAGTERAEVAVALAALNVLAARTAMKAGKSTLG